MKIGNVLRICIAISVTLWLAAAWPAGVIGAESAGREAVNKEMEQDIGMPILAGDLWQKMTHDDKVAFIWGCWHVVSIEHYLMDKYPQLKTDDFSAKVVEATHKAPKTANDIVALIDGFYKDHPDDVEKPVMGVLWDEWIKPNITTGIAGRPLKQ